MYLCDSLIIFNKNTTLFKFYGVQLHKIDLFYGSQYHKTMKNMLYRVYQDLETHLKPNKVLLIYGPRQVGKTTLLENFLTKTDKKYRLDTGDNIRIQQLLGNLDLESILAYAEGYELIVIDEAQMITNIGQAMKILVDQVPGIHIILTGSSSFELAGQIGEPLTGRKKTLTLYPFSQYEFAKSHTPYDLKQQLENALLFGGYPEVVVETTRAGKIELLKDILQFDRVKNPKVLLDLLRLLAFQIGHEVSLNELSQKLSIDVKTVGRYLDLLEKTFVIYRLGGFSRNLRSEVTKKAKYFFYDLGVRNTIIANFNPLEMRNDIGQLWENFLCIERLKTRHYTQLIANPYFWRTWEQKEIDLIEERDGKLFAYEFKWRDGSAKPPKLWQKTYPDANFKVITQDNYLTFLTEL